MDSGRAYNIVIFSLAGIISCIFIYSGFFFRINESYHIECIYKKITGTNCPGCGLSAGFAEIMHGNFEKANTLNPYCRYIFLFFVIQLMIRIILLVYHKNAINFLSKDILVSSFLFIILWFGMLKSIFFIFKGLF
jgi:hypothetical protein